MGDFAEVERQLLQAQKDIEVQFKERDFHGTILFDEIARVYYNQGRFNDAERKKWRRKIQILEAQLFLQAEAINHFANWLIEIGEYARVGAMLSGMLDDARDLGGQWTVK